MKDAEHKKALRLAEPTDGHKVQGVLAYCGANPTQAELIKIGQDSFLIAAARGHDDRLIVTAEVSRKAATGSNRKVPDVCDDCGVQWRTPVELINEMDFTTARELM